MVKTNKIIIVTLLIIAILSTSNLFGLDNVYAADLMVIVQTDKAVYNPGENVIITVRVQKIVGGDMVLGVDGANVFVSIEPPGGGIFSEIATPTAIVGEYSYTYTLPPTAGGGVYKVGAEATHPGDNPGSDQTTFTVTGAPGKKSVDWRVENPWITPGNPTTEDPVINNVWLRFVTVSPGPYPVDIICTVDGVPVGGGTITPTGIEMTVYTPARKYSSGTHMVTWIVDPDHDYNDMNLADNQVNFQFTVTTPIVTTEAPTTTQTATTTPTTSQTQQPTGDFTILASPIDTSILPGESATFTLTVDKTGEFNDPVAFTEVTGQPSDSAFDLRPEEGFPQFNALLRVDTPESTKPGTYMITVQASGGGKTHSATVTLTIKEKPTEMETPEPTTTEAAEAESSMSTLLSNPMYLMIIVVAIIGGGVIAALARRGRPPTPRPAPKTAPPQTEAPTGYCAKCGAELKPGAAFCRSCGERVE